MAGIFQRLFAKGSAPPPPTPSVPAPADPLDSIPGLTALLESLEANVMFADTQLILRYANRRSLKTLRAVEGEIRKVFHLGVDDIIGGSIHRFHRDPARVEQILHNH